MKQASILEIREEIIVAISNGQIEHAKKLISVYREALIEFEEASG
ncbi:hypothetical protein [Photobacterium proteolyticum]|nr:hypothetical protein [Photobacterium proteolyticum]